MTRLRRLSLTALLAVGTAAALVACGGDADDGDGDGSPTATATSSNQTTVEFALDEYEIRGPDSATAGTIRFDVTNDGTMPHQFVIIRSDAALDALPVENEDDLDVIGELEEFPAGDERSTTFNLGAGRYLLICNIPGHYELGMVTEFTVQ